jgi:molecular chaperone HscB
MSCWSCGGDPAPGEAACGCGALQPPAPGADHFAVLGLPRAYALDPAALEARFRELSRQVHPDRFARAEPRQRRIALERTTRVIDAYRTLRVPRRRAAYLLQLLAPDLAQGARTTQALQLSPDFLASALDRREALAQARKAAAGAALERIAAEARARVDALDRALAAGLATSPPDRAALRAVAAALAELSFDEVLLAEAEAALQAVPGEARAAAPGAAPAAAPAAAAPEGDPSADAAPAGGSPAADGEVPPVAREG